jgi:hypothetical protein
MNLINEIIASGLNMQAFIALAMLTVIAVLIEVSDLACTISPSCSTV